MSKFTAYIGSHTHVASLSSVLPIPRPKSLNVVLYLWLQPISQNVRITTDGSDPTATHGFQLAAGDDREIPVAAGNIVKVIEETASATLEYIWVRRE